MIQDYFTIANSSGVLMSVPASNGKRTGWEDIMRYMIHIFSKNNNSDSDDNNATEWPIITESPCALLQHTRMLDGRPSLS